MTSPSDLAGALETVRTFLAAFYHENDDIVGGTRALQYMLGKRDYRQEVADAFQLVLLQASEGELTEVVRTWANRDVRTGAEAEAYLLDLFERNLFHFDVDTLPGRRFDQPHASS